MTKPAVTIITVTYNAEKDIASTIQSIISQTSNKIEYILIDNKSTDKTKSIVEKYKKHISTFVSETDLGIYDAMNKGLALAKGDLVLFLNAGDTLYNNKVIEDVLNEYTKKPANILLGKLCYFGQTNRKRKIVQKKLPVVKCGTSVYHQATFVERKILQNKKFSTKYKLAGDYDLFCRLYKDKDTYRLLDFPIANYIDTGISSPLYISESQIEIPNFLGFIENLKILREHFGILRSLLFMCYILTKIACKLCKYIITFSRRSPTKYK